MISGEVEDIFKKYFKNLRGPITELGGFIAGGACLRLLRTWDVGLVPTTDIDIYFQTKYPIEKIVGIFTKYIPKFDYKVKILNDNLIYLSIDKLHEGIMSLHIIRNYFGTVEEIISKFDFSVCQIGYDFKRVFVGEKTIEDIQSNTLRLVNITDPDKIYLRIVKYEGKGFVPTDHTCFMKELFKPLAKGNSYSY